MNSETMVPNWQSKILATCRTKLGRELMDFEREFVTSRCGLLALEAIEENVCHLSESDLEKYLQSERLIQQKP
ncbi:MAG: hypothetical protein JJU29_20970 [Verrucomicrobia bacterium]|nr:hypothetical protein [Verrucomicrobiota bacterium]